MIKRYILTPLSAFLMLGFILIIGLILVLFFRPELILNPQTLSFALKKSSFFKEWSWKKADFKHEWLTWNKRKFSGSFNDFCFILQKPAADVQSCINLSWDVNFGFVFDEGFFVEAKAPVSLFSPDTRIALKKTDQKEKKDSGPPPIWKYWTMLWDKKVPPLDLKFSKVTLISSGEEKVFDLELKKRARELKASAMGYEIAANPEKIIFTPPSPLPLPKALGAKKDPSFYDLKLTAIMKKEGIPLALTGRLEELELFAESRIDLPLKGSFTSNKFKKSFLSAASGKIVLNNVKDAVSKYSPEPYDELPAPLNVMNGEILLTFEAEALDDNKVLVKTITGIDLKSRRQMLSMDVSADIPLDVSDFSRGLIRVGVDFDKVTLQLPRLSRKSPPPQFFPDGRFVKPGEKKKENEEGKKSTLALDIEALNEKALHLRTNLLDEELRLNFNLQIREGEVKDGFVKVLSLKTKIFRRPIILDHLTVDFDFPKPPVLDAVIKFPLPEYKITLKLEGPVSDPRYALSSDPPLPEDDIMAVLLFGRPMDDLGPEDKTAASRTGQLLSQGILSLSVLYFLAGSPVEYIGYDPGSKKAFAQIGLGRKSSLRVGTQSGGAASTSVRRSLGNGWYLDTSVQENINDSDRGANYGVLLERVIAY